MNRCRATLLWKGLELPWLGLALLALVGCGGPDPNQRPQPPDALLDFRPLYAKNCAGCHGAEGRLGPAPPLNDPLFLAIISDAELKRVIAEGRVGMLMPAFSTKQGGELTEQQIEAIVAGVRREWQQQPGHAEGSSPPYRSADSSRKEEAGNPEKGATVFARACACCHGDQGQGNDAGAVNDGAFLALMSDQALRRIAITGRPDLGMPDYRTQSDRPAGFEPLSSQEITDVVALLKSWRNAKPPEAKAAAGKTL